MVPGRGGQCRVRPMNENAPQTAMAATIRVPQDAVRRQIVAILRAWGVAAPHADAAGELLVYADLRGIESHGLAMMANYEVHKGQGSFVRGARGGAGARDAGPGAARWRRRDGPPSGDARDGAGDREMRHDRHRRGHRAQFLALRRGGLLRRDGGQARLHRHGHDLGVEQRGGADLCRRGDARHQPDRARRPGAAQPALRVRHGEQHRRRRQDPARRDPGQADPGRLVGRPATASPRPTRSAPGTIARSPRSAARPRCRATRATGSARWSRSSRARSRARAMPRSRSSTDATAARSMSAISSW